MVRPSLEVILTSLRPSYGEPAPARVTVRAVIVSAAPEQLPEPAAISEKPPLSIIPLSGATVVEAGSLALAIVVVKGGLQAANALLILERGELGKYRAIIIMGKTNKLLTNNRFFSK